MDITAIREQLHNYINIADEQHLSAIYTLLEDKIDTDHDSIYDEATMAMLNERRESHRNGTSKSYTPEESIELARKSRKNNEL